MKIQIKTRSRFNLNFEVFLLFFPVPTQNYVEFWVAQPSTPRGAGLGKFPACLPLVGLLADRQALSSNCCKLLSLSNSLTYSFLEFKIELLWVGLSDSFCPGGGIGRPARGRQAKQLNGVPRQLYGLTAINYQLRAKNHYCFLSSK